MGKCLSFLLFCLRGHWQPARYSRLLGAIRRLDRVSMLLGTEMSKVEIRLYISFSITMMTAWARLSKWFGCVHLRWKTFRKKTQFLLWWNLAECSLYRRFIKTHWCFLKDFLTILQISVILVLNITKLITWDYYRLCVILLTFLVLKNA